MQNIELLSKEENHEYKDCYYSGNLIFKHSGDFFILKKTISSELFSSKISQTLIQASVYHALTNL